MTDWFREYRTPPTGPKGLWVSASTSGAVSDDPSLLAAQVE